MQDWKLVENSSESTKEGRGSANVEKKTQKDPVSGNGTAARRNRSSERSGDYCNLCKESAETKTGNGCWSAVN